MVKDSGTVDPGHHRRWIRCDRTRQGLTWFAAYATHLLVRNPAIVRHYYTRAEAFYRSARTLFEDAPHRPSVGLLTVHSAIALADALLVAEHGSRCRDEDHSVAATSLEKICSARRVDSAGVKHFRALLARKSKFAYGEDSVRDEEYTMAKTKMEQFFKWVYATFPYLQQLSEVTDA